MHFRKRFAGLKTKAQQPLESERIVVTRKRRQLLAAALTGILLPIAPAFAQSQMPDQRGTLHVLAGTGLAQNGRTLSLSVPVSASIGGAGTVNGILKANGSGIVSAAAAGTDYAPVTSGTSLLKGNGAGGFSGAVSGADYAPPTSGTSILKGSGTGGFSNAVAGTDYQRPIAGNSLVAHNFATSISSAGAISGAQPAFSDLSGSVASSQMPALTGDTISTAGSTVTTNVKLNGVSYQANPSTDTVPVITGTNTATYTPLSNCVDSSGNHLNYSTTTHAFSCGTTSSSSTPRFVTAMTASTALTTYGGL
jgi:hypothetical protein